MDFCGIKKYERRDTDIYTIIEGLNPIVKIDIGIIVEAIPNINNVLNGIKTVKYKIIILNAT